MPTTEVPTGSPGRPPEQPLFRRKRTRYEDLEPDELLHLIDSLEDERSRARRREGIWISVVAHLILFWFIFYGPRVLWHQPRVVNPADVLKNRKDLTYLDLPPDALKKIRPRPQAPLSDKNRIAQSQHPTLDRKTLEQLQAMRRAGPPAPVPPRPQPQAPVQQAAPQPPAQQQAQSQPPRPAPQPLQPNPQAQLEAPKPAPTQPSFNNNTTPSDAIRQAIQNAARNQGQSSGDYGANAPSEHPAMSAGVDILSDTMGVDFGPYMRRVIAATYRSWLPIIPESARPPLDKQGRVGIRFKIFPDGSVKQMILEFPSGDVALDKAAWGGITGAAPYPALPKDFKGPFLELRFGFYYNLDPKQQ
ncbi:MAG TPA: energy transducer TonB [Acidobacteriaceae bacterium]|nr:energy transducer TonB [Acidobacteriaceae bacterium]